MSAIPASPWARTQAVVAALANSIAAGDVEPTIAELRALAHLCDQRHLPLEAARIRRWLDEGTSVDAVAKGRDVL